MVIADAPDLDLAGVRDEAVRTMRLALTVLLPAAVGYLVLAQSANFSHNMTAGRGFMALYQQRPTPADGDFFKDEMIHTYDGLLNSPEKVKAKGCCAPIWECDEDGEAVKR